jgi:hypothetical protein
VGQAFKSDKWVSLRAVMNQNNKNADHSAHADDDLILEAETLRRLESIRKADENADEAITRMLDNAVEKVPIETIMTDLLDRFEDVASINVNLSASSENPGMLLISVHTGDAGWEDNITFREGKESRAVIESKAGEQFCLPFDIIATCDGPKRESIGTTPIYMTDDVLGAEPVTLDEGLDQLRAKIGKSRDELRAMVYDHIDH